MWWLQNVLIYDDIYRPLMSEFPNDEKTFALDECFMLGSSILVHPVVRKGDTKALVYLPPSSVSGSK